MKDRAIDASTDRILRMQCRRVTRVLTSWLAILAFMTAALAPSISHALSSGNRLSWVEVCTPTGAKWVQAAGDAADETPAPAAVHPLEHCPYCSLHFSALALPAASAATVPLLVPTHDLPIAFLAAPRTLYAWVSAQPRAPPQFA